MNIAISIPVHEAPEVIASQAHNFLDSTADMTVILHVSANAPDLAGHLERLLAPAIAAGRLLINPRRLKTNLKNVLAAHVENFLHLERSGHPFAYFCCNASNDLLIRPHLDQWIVRHDAGLRFMEFPLAKDEWLLPEAAKDQEFLRMLAASGYRTDVIVGSQIEGTFYRRELLSGVMHQIADAMTDFATSTYPREEIVLPTLVCRSHDMSRLRVTRPFVFVPWGRRPSLLKFLQTHKRRDYDVTIGDIDQLLAQAHPGCAEPAAVYGVKRVPRTMASPVRQYINRLMEASGASAGGPFQRGPGAPS